MNRNIDSLRDAVRESLRTLSDSFERLNALVDERRFTTEGELRKHLARLELSLKQNHERLSAALSDFDKWTNEELQTRNQISAWKAKRDTSRLHARADMSEKSATAALEIAALVIKEAECAAIRAMLGRKEAVSLQVRER